MKWATQKKVTSEDPSTLDKPKGNISVVVYLIMQIPTLLKNQITKFPSCFMKMHSFLIRKSILLLDQVLVSDVRFIMQYSRP